MVKNIENLYEIYQNHAEKWQAFLEESAKELTALLKSNGLKVSVKYRIKEFDSYVKKIIQTKRAGKKKRAQISDLFGLRVIVPFLEDVDQAIELITKNYDIVEVERKSETLSFREFAYDSVHLNVSFNKEGITCPPQSKKVCEIQVRTILQDAWAEVEHELIYKSNFEFPNESIKKKLAALNANLTLSDIIFQEIRDYTKELESWGNNRFQMLKTEALKLNPDILPKLLEKQKKQHAISGKPRVNKKLDKLILNALEAHNDEEYEQAVDFYSKALLEDTPLKIRSIIFNHRGMANYMLGLEREALQDFESSCQCDNKNFRALNNRGLVFRRLGFINQALNDFGQSLEIEGNQAEVFFLRAQTRFEVGEYEATKADLVDALKLQPHYPEAEELMKMAMKFINGEKLEYRH